MVRLEFRNLGATPKVYEFQFHNGAVGVAHCLLLRQGHNNFNSIMVRLEFAQANRISALPVEFQFHNGAVGVMNIHVPTGSIMISIP